MEVFHNWGYPAQSGTLTVFVSPKGRTDLYMEMFSISWLEALSCRMIPRGETFNVTFWSFFPLALAWKEGNKEKEKMEKRGCVSEKEGFERK